MKTSSQKPARKKSKAPYLLRDGAAYKGTKITNDIAQAQADLNPPQIIPILSPDQFPPEHPLADPRRCAVINVVCSLHTVPLSAKKRAELAGVGERTFKMYLADPFVVGAVCGIMGPAARGAVQFLDNVQLYHGLQGSATHAKNFYMRMGVRGFTRGALSATSSSIDPQDLPADSDLEETLTITRTIRRRAQARTAGAQEIPAAEERKT